MFGLWFFGYQLIIIDTKRTSAYKSQKQPNNDQRFSQGLGLVNRDENYNCSEKKVRFT